VYVIEASCVYAGSLNISLKKGTWACNKDCGIWNCTSSAPMRKLIKG